MQSVSIQTTQNIQLDYPIAGLGDRMLAFFIDYMIAISFVVISFLLSNAVLTGSSNVLSITLIIVFILYRPIAEIAFNGQTVGKKALSIKVVKLDGSNPSFAAYLLRWILEPIDFMIVGVAVLSIILTRNGQRLGDLLAGTTVVKMKKVSSTLVRNKMVIKGVDENYEPVFPEAIHLTDEEVQLIKDALKAYRMDATVRPIERIAAKIKAKLNIQSDDTTVKFLYTILRDHTYYTTR